MCATGSASALRLIKDTGKARCHTITHTVTDTVLRDFSVGHGQLILELASRDRDHARKVALSHQLNDALRIIVS